MKNSYCFKQFILIVFIIIGFVIIGISLFNYKRSENFNQTPLTQSEGSIQPPKMNDEQKNNVISKDYIKSYLSDAVDNVADLIMTKQNATCSQITDKTFVPTLNKEQSLKLEQKQEKIFVPELNQSLNTEKTFVPRLHRNIIRSESGISDVDIIKPKITKQFYQKYDLVNHPSSYDPYIGRDYIAYRNLNCDRNYVSKRPGCMACQVDLRKDVDHNYDGTKTNIISTCLYDYNNKENNGNGDIWDYERCKKECSLLSDKK